MTLTATRVPDAIELNKYGWFRTWKHKIVTIAKADVQSITSDLTNMYRESFQGAAPTETIEFSLKNFGGTADWGMIIDQLEWGSCSAPDKVYFELNTYSKLMDNQFTIGFCNSGFISGRTNEVAPVPPFTDKVVLKLWNGSSPAEDVWVEPSFSYYMFPLSNKDAVINLSLGEYFKAELEKKDRIIELLGGMPEPPETPDWNRLIRLLEEIAGHWVSFDREVKELLKIGVPK